MAETKTTSVEEMRRKARDPFADDDETPMPEADDNSMSERMGKIESGPAVSTDAEDAGPEPAPKRDALEVLRGLGVQELGPRSNWGAKIRKYATLAGTGALVWAGINSVAHHHQSRSTIEVTAASGDHIKIEPWQAFYLVTNEGTGRIGSLKKGSAERTGEAKGAWDLYNALFKNVHDKEARLVVFTSASILTAIDGTPAQAAALFKQGSRWSEDKAVSQDWRFAASMKELATRLARGAKPNSEEARNWRDRADKWGKAQAGQKSTVRGEGWNDITEREFRLGVAEARAEAAQITSPSQKRAALAVINHADGRIREIATRKITPPLGAR